MAGRTGWHFRITGGVGNNRRLLWLRVSSSRWLLETSGSIRCGAVVAPREMS